MRPKSSRPRGDRDETSPDSPDTENQNQVSRPSRDRAVKTDTLSLVLVKLLLIMRIFSAA